jgi:hypothetical protein
MTLRYLEFDYSEDTEGVGTFDAMASVGPAQLGALHAEVVRVLNWAVARFGAAHGPIDEGFDWDYDLQSHQEYVIHERLLFDPRSGQLCLHPAHPGVPRHAVSLSITGSPAFGAALRQSFDLG